MAPEQVRDAWALPNAKAVPLLGTAFGTELEELDEVETIELMMSEVLDYVARPPSLASDDQAYAVTVIGDSQAPRFEPGEIAYVSPKATVTIGDDVLVQLRDPGDNGEGSQLAGRITTVLLKRLVKRTSRYIELRQFNPEKIFQVPIERVRRIHRVKGRL
jgi:phage repressor protein C with HTH and peptisase S24 domain